ncbi:hypothetical protein BC829DRAFT_443889 [Chytridium lagenaria]|nr:hypothetical protein BC829DRAFT_443889 [Chytridium lagenaria]
MSSLSTSIPTPSSPYQLHLHLDLHPVSLPSPRRPTSPYLHQRMRYKSPLPPNHTIHHHGCVLQILSDQSSKQPSRSLPLPSSTPSRSNTGSPPTDSTVAKLTRTVIPSITLRLSTTATNHKAVPLKSLGRDVNVEASISSVDTVKNAPVKVSLPKLALSEHDLQAKLANTEARWKDLEEAQAERRNHRRRGPKPTLTHTKKEVDPETLKRRLLEKEALASTNRAREITKLQTKLARQDEHLRRVQERKRALGRLSNEDLNLSWGGEDGEGKEGRRIRSGSGRSMGTNGEMVDDRNVVQVAPLPQRYSLAL